MSALDPFAIGIIGGLSPESTVTYYQTIVRRHQEAFHNHAYPRIVITSVCLQQYIDWQHAGKWDRISAELQQEFEAAAAAGADFAILSSNTMHKVLPAISSPIPVLSITDVVSQEAGRLGLTRLALTGTRYVMSDGFYARALEHHGLNVLLPTPEQQETIHRLIYDELISGKVSDQAIDRFGQIARDLMARGAETVLLACTELELLTRNGAFPTPTLDTARLHAEYAWEMAVERRLPA